MKALNTASTRVYTVLVIDDSAVIRHFLTNIINAHPSFRVIGSAEDPYVAREQIKTLNPDLLTLDVEMPRMNGLQFLSNLMRLRPMPVIMVSSLTSRGTADSLEALRIGAVDVLPKPDFQSNHCIDSFSRDLHEKLATAASINRAKLTSRSDMALCTPTDPALSRSRRNSRRLLAFGASTGGTIALQEIFRRLPSSTPGTVVVQHIPGAFSKPFADSLNKCSAMQIQQACDGDVIKQGHAYVAPGTDHLYVTCEHGEYRCRLSSAEPVNRHKPSVDVLFQSVAREATDGSMGVLLTGMGKDGAQGLLEMRNRGFVTIAQDEASSVVWGMPGSAVQLDAATHVKPLLSIADLITSQS